jgi:uncharacterized membrane protein
MMMWHGENGFSWLDCLLTVPMVMVLWAAVIAAVVVAMRYHLSDQRIPASNTDSTSASGHYASTESRSRGGIYDDEFHPRLM